MKKLFTIILLLFFVEASTIVGAEEKKGDHAIEALAERHFNGMNAGDKFGGSVASAGDVNGDGYDDLIIGAYSYSSARGRAYLFFGGANVDFKADVILEGEADNNNFGGSVASAGDVNGDGYDDVIVGAPKNDAGGTNAGRAYIYFGGASMSTTAVLTLNGAAASDNFGTSVSSAGDVNSDGYADVIVGAYMNGSGGSNAGRAYIYYGGASMNNIADLTFDGKAPGDYLGKSVSTAGDVNGDGYADVIIGSYGNDANGSFAGLATIYFGGASMDNKSDVTMFGEAIEDNFGYSVSTAGDVNGDGYDDVIVGAYLNDSGGSNAGRAYLYYGGSSMNSTADVTFTGDITDDSFGVSVSSAKDVNGDGYSDVIVGSFGNDTGGSSAGKAHVYYGGSTMDNVVDVMCYGEAASDFFGWAVSSAGDMNGDGYDDFIVGAINNDINGSNSGRAYLYINSLTGPDIYDLFMTGAAADDKFGYSVSSAGDVNGDGYDDFIVGANFNSSGGNSAGSAYLYLGGPFMDNVADLTFTGETAQDYFGTSVANAGDVNGDGYDDIIIGAPGWDSPFDSNVGRSYIYFGGVSMNVIADVTLSGGLVGSEFGNSVSSAGDVNGDGYDDVIVGAHKYGLSTTVKGRAYIYYGGAAMDNGYDWWEDGEADGDYFGTSVSSAGDVNGDGYDDVIIAAPRNDLGGNAAGRVYIYHGSSSMDTSFDLTFDGSGSFDSFGQTVSCAGDLNGDGYDDVIVGDLYNAGGKGKSHVFYGSSTMNSTADVTMTGEAGGDYFGESVSSAGDLNGDGFDDVIVGAWGNDFGGSTAGRSYVYLSSSPPIKPRLVSAKDVPNDQGGYIKLKWIRSGYDADGSSNITEYKVQRSDPPNNGGYFWETVGTVTPTHNKYYMYVAETMNDSITNASSTYFYRVIASTADQSEYWISNITSGHSVDNISPSVVTNLANTIGSGNVILDWSPNTESDLYNYQIYKTTETSFDPNTATIYASTTDTIYTDANSSNTTINYYVRAVDVHGNAGALASTTANVLLTTNIKFFLEGANAGSGTMTTFLNGGGYIPLIQPYSASPWNYAGTESVTSIPTGVVDWVLIELRTNTTTIAEKRAAFLKSNGTLVDLDGTSPVNFPNSNAGNYYVVVVHRNHLPIMTANAVPLSNNPPLYDMSTSQTNTYGVDPLKDIGSGYYGMFSGDANGNGQIQNNDSQDYWKVQNGESGYKSGDFNLNGQVQNNDSQDLFEINNGVGGQVPIGINNANNKIVRIK